MRLLVLSDIHADAARLERVLAHADARGWDELLVLGDVVGYGPEPGRCVDALRSRAPLARVQGNHEWMLAQLLAGERPDATPEVVRVLEAHAAALDAEQLAFLRGFAEEHVAEGWAAVHGAPRRRFEYILAVPTARANAGYMKRALTFVGHSHVPGAFVEAGERWRPCGALREETRIDLMGVTRAFVNPGAVAGARDRGGGFSYAIFDEAAATATIHRLRD